MLSNSKSILLFWLIPVLIYLIWYLKDIIFLIFFSLVLGLAIQEWAIVIKKKIKTPFIINIALIYLIFISILVFSIYLLTPIILKEIKNIFPQVKEFLDDLGFKNIEKYLPNLFNYTPQSFLNFSGYIINILGGFFNFILIIILSFYVSTQPNFFIDIFKLFFPNKFNIYLKFYNRVKKKFSYWLASQIFLMIAVGFLTYILMIILKVPYAGLIGLIAGITEIVPILGPIIAASIGIFISFTSNPQIVIWVLLGFILIQQLENNLLIPLLAKKVLEIKPLVTLSSILIGAKLGGILGIMTVLPLSVLLVEIYNEFYNLNNNLNLNNNHA
jgi:predicted PurR-regulated permease PerM